MSRRAYFENNQSMHVGQPLLFERSPPRSDQPSPFAGRFGLKLPWSGCLAHFGRDQSIERLGNIFFIHLQLGSEPNFRPAFLDTVRP